MYLMKEASPIFFLLFIAGEKPHLRISLFFNESWSPYLQFTFRYFLFYFFNPPEKSDHVEL
jgi:hypothetical protein